MMDSLHCLQNETTLHWNSQSVTDCKLKEHSALMISSYQLANSDVVMWIMVVFASTIATFLLLTLIHFERCGGDPQKRSLGNRLLSNNLTIILIQCWIRNAYMIAIRYTNPRAIGDEMPNLIIFVTR